MSDTPQYGENGFIPTVTGYRYEDGEEILVTLDPRPETDLQTNPLQRVGDAKTDEQKKKLKLWDNN